jgi:ferredoxin
MSRRRDVGNTCRRAPAREAFALVALAGLDGRAADSKPLRLTEPQATAGAVLTLSSGRENVIIEHDASPLGLVTCNSELCTLCGACAAACPTDALRLDEGPDEAVLTYDPGACLACGRCAATCPENALSARPGFDLEALRRHRHAIARSDRSRCRECGEPLLPVATLRRVQSLLGVTPSADGGELCTACARGSRTHDLAAGLPSAAGSPTSAVSARTRL